MKLQIMTSFKQKPGFSDSGRRMRAWRLCCTILTVCLLLYGMRLKAYAAPPLLVDEADVLDASQEAELTGELEDISEKYDIDVAIYIVKDLYGKDALDYADDIYVYDEYGTGDDYSGILLLHKPSPIPGETEYAITCDGRVRETISVSKIDDMLDDMADAIVSGRDRGNYLPPDRVLPDECVCTDAGLPPEWDGPLLSDSLRIGVFVTVRFTSRSFEIRSCGP